MKFKTLHSVKAVNKKIHPAEIWWRRPAYGWNGFAAPSGYVRAKLGMEKITVCPYKGKWQYKIPARILAKLKREV